MIMANEFERPLPVNPVTGDLIEPPPAEPLPPQEPTYPEIPINRVEMAAAGPGGQSDSDFLRQVLYEKEKSRLRDLGRRTGAGGDVSREERRAARSTRRALVDPSTGMSGSEKAGMIAAAIMGTLAAGSEGARKAATGIGDPTGVKTRVGSAIQGLVGQGKQRLAQRAAAEGPKKGAFDQEHKLRTQFQGLTKQFRSVRDSYGRVKESAVDPSAAGDLALIFNYMKMLDPGSVVRESEFANAAASGSLGQRWVAFGKKLLSGERLGDKVRKDFIDRSNKLYAQQERQYEATVDVYKRLADEWGLSPENITAGAKIAEAKPDKHGFIKGRIYTDSKTGAKRRYKGNNQWEKIK
jgi:hypothetical protein